MNQKEEIIEFINSLPNSAEEKQKMLDRLQTDGISQAFIDDLISSMESVDNKLREDYKPQIEELDNTYTEYSEEVNKANGEFEAEMQALELEALETENTANKELEEIELNDVRDNLN